MSDDRTEAIAAFLMARVRDDEAVAGKAIMFAGEGGDEWESPGYQQHLTITRDSEGLTDVGIECAAKRAMIGLLRADAQDPHNALRRAWANEILALMAKRWVSHPDYPHEPR